jgi:hypothetical protein
MSARSNPRLNPRNLVLAAACLTLAATLSFSATAEARVGATFSKRLLKVQGTAKSERIVIDCNESSKVLINGRAPKLLAGGALPCARVAEVDVRSGDGNDRIDLKGVDASFAEARFAGFGTGTLTAVISGAGDDQIDCGDVFCFVPDAGTGNDLIRGGSRRDILRGGGENDRILGLEGRDDLLGRAGNDYLAGGEGDDLISGNAGDDRLYGEPGADLIGGGSGNDLLKGGPGNDRLLGGPGKDRIVGGPGKNTIVQDPPRRKKT